MAFENINWFAPATARQAEAANFQNMIGQFVADRQRNKELELKRLEIENKPIDMTKLAQAGAMEIAATGQTTPDKIAALKAYEAFQRPYIDPLTQEMVMPASPLQTLMGGQFQSPMQQAPIPQNGNMMMGDGSPAVGGATFATPEEQSQLVQMVGVAPEPMGAFLPPKGGVNKPVVNDIELSPDISAALQAMNMPRAEVPQKLKDTPYGTKLQIEESKDIAKEQRQAIREQEKSRTQKEIERAELNRPSFEPIEGFTPSPEDLKTMTKITVSQKMLSGLIGDYREALKSMEGSGAAIAGTEKAKEIDRIGGKIRMQVKNLEELGALQEPDIKAMNEMLGSAVISWGDITNPVNVYTQYNKGKKIADASMLEFGKYVDNVVKNNAEVRGFRLKSEEKPVGSQKPTIEQIKAELARRQGM